MPALIGWTRESHQISLQFACGPTEDFERQWENLKCKGNRETIYVSKYVLFLCVISLETYHFDKFGQDNLVLKKKFNFREVLSFSCFFCCLLFFFICTLKCFYNVYYLFSVFFYLFTILSFSRSVLYSCITPYVGWVIEVLPLQFTVCMWS